MFSQGRLILAGLGRAVGSSRCAASARVFLLVTAAGCPSAAGEAASTVRGVAPSEQAKYAAEGFRCLTADTAGQQETALPPSVINDDFCDCGDGSDEPGTSACAGQKTVLFYCPNEGSIPAYVYSSHVNDGICDCCDGSDEWHSASPATKLSSEAQHYLHGRAQRSEPCPNHCAKEGQALLRERARKETELRNGIVQRRSLIQEGHTQREKASAELQSLRDKLTQLEGKEREAADAKKAAQARLREEDEERKKAEEQLKARVSSQQNATDSHSHAESAAGTATASASTSGSAVNGDVAGASEFGQGEVPAVSEYAKWMEGGEKSSSIADGGKAHATTPEGKRVEAGVSEYTKWMDGAEEVLQSSSNKAKEEEPESDVSSPRGRDPSSGPFTRAWGKICDASRWLWQSVVGGRSPSQRAVDAAEKLHKEASQVLRESKDRIKDLEDKVGQDLDEDKLAYAGLSDRCIKKEVGGYKYEVCFFKEAKQGSVSIGTWSKWEDSHVALFDDGQYCPGGLYRSLRVRFQCGYREDILEIAEPSRCAYEATVTHPAACTEALLETLQNLGPRRPTDEL